MTDLTKWPRLLVVGQPVTEQQANDILIRTQEWPPITNDREWEQDIAAVLAEHGVQSRQPNGWSWTGLTEWEKRIRVLRLCYLDNQRIASSRIGGPHGWCDWDGTIGCDTYNIGKWPTVEAVTADWQAIAAAWPFLNLRAQLVPDEGDADSPAVEWRVHDGRVKVIDDPGGLIRRGREPEFALPWLRGRERGVSLDRLREAIAQAVLHA